MSTENSQPLSVRGFHSYTRYCAARATKKGEKSKVEREELRDQIREALKSEIKSQRSRVERKRRNFEAETSSHIMVRSSIIVEPIQRYYAANAREFR